MATKKCIVKSCGQLTNVFALPSNHNIRAEWLKRCGFQDYKEDPHQNLRVCPKHFDKVCFKIDGKGLLKFSVPSLFIPNYVITGEQEDNFIFPQKEAETTPKRIKDVLSEPSTSVYHTPPAKVKTPQRVYGRKKADPEIEIPASGGTIDTSSVQVQAGPSSVIKTTPGEQVEPTLMETSRVQQGKRSKVMLRLKKMIKESHTVPKISTEVQDIIKLLEERGDLLDYLGKTNVVSLNFFATNLRNLKVKPRGRRFNIDDKILALALYKQSSKAYRFLSKYFTLPSRKCLSNILNRVPLLSGINKSIFDHLKASVSKLKEEDRYCILMFDEISLQPRLRYNKRHDYIEGFVDLGNGRRRIQFADHALVFMAKGVRTTWKQPIFFGFCEGTTSTDDLVSCIESVIAELQTMGLIVVATISDQGSTNRAAINHLVQKRNEGPLLFTIGGQEIVHIYDPPHLLKGIRNGLLTKDLSFTIDGSKKVASWSHILRYFQIDQQQGPFVQCTKLTDEHVVPSKIRKMKVKHASQVFSHTLASAMHIRALLSERHRLEESDPDYLDPQALDTATLLLFFDKLFDSVNGLTRDAPPGKSLRCVVTDTSAHESFWLSAIPTLTSLSFQSTTKSHPVQSHTPSIKHWISTVHGFIYLKKKLLPVLDFFSPRTFNQDPLENFFSQIRSHAHRNTNCSTFINAYKALLVSGFTSVRSVGANCEEDESVGPLDVLRRFVKEVEAVVCPVVEGDISLSTVPDAMCTDFASDYVTGAVVKSFFRRFTCNDCHELLCSFKELPEHLQMRQFEGHHLVNPTEVTTFVVNQITLAILEILPSILHKYGVKQILINELKNRNFTFLLCDKHKEKQIDLLNIITNIVLFNYIKKINRVLKGIDSRLINSDELFNKAHMKYLKYSRRPR